MADRIPMSELESYLWGSAVLLRTNIDAGSYKQYIFPLLFFKRLCDVYDEETAEYRAQYGEFAEEFEDCHTFVIPEGRHWRDVRMVTEDVGQAISVSDALVQSQFVEMFGDASRSENKYPIKPLSDICSIIQDGEHATVKRTDVGNLFISSRNIKADHSIVLDAVTYISDSDFERIRKRFAPEQGDIILTCAGTIGNSAIVPQMAPFVADRGLTMIRPNKEIIGSIYLHACILSSYVQQQMQVGIHATALAHLYLNKINALRVIVPPLPEQKRFESLTSQTDKSKLAIRQALESIEKSRAAIMARIFG